MQITLNGQKHSLVHNISIAALIEDLMLDPRKIAIEHNLEIISANQYTNTYLKDGDILEVVQFIGGG